MLDALRVRRGHVVVAGLVGAYVTGWALSPLVMRGTRTDLDFFFWPAAQIAAHGHPLSVYSFQTAGNYPDANGPVGLLPLMPLAAIANAFGWTDSRIAAAMVAVVASIFALLFAREALRLITMARGGLEWALAGYAAFLLAPVLWIAVTGFGHLEQVIEVYALLLAVRFLVEGGTLRTGAGIGIALLARTAALASVIPLVAMAERNRGKVIAMTLAVAAIGLAPFLLADGNDVIHSLVGYRGALPIGGGSVWVGLHGSALATVIEHGDAVATLAVATVLSVAVVRRRPDITADIGATCGLVAISAACFPMLAKTVHTYYLLEPTVFATVWWLARPGTALSWRAAVPALLTIDAFLCEWSVTLPLSGIGVVEGIASSLILAAVIALITADLRRSRAATYRFTESAAAAPQGWR